MGSQFSRRHVLAGAAASLALGRAGPARSAASSPGISANEIKLGTTAYYSGPASTAAAYGQTQVAYFQMVNDGGGINGRKVNLISLDNAFSPPKAIEQTRRLVESDEVFAIAGSLGTPTNVAIQKYLNGKGVPNLDIRGGTIQRSQGVSLDHSILSDLCRTGGIVRQIYSSRTTRCKDRRAV
jgi:branched-chain amino acid transport system substrate-binding protein